MDAATFARLGEAAGELVGKPPSYRGRFYGIPVHGTHREVFESEAWQSSVFTPEENERLERGIVHRVHDFSVFVSLTKLEYNNRRVWGGKSGRKFFMIKTDEELEAFLRRVPQPHRVMEEIIFKDTPHRFYFDIETDEFEQDVDIPVRIAYLATYLEEKFLDIIANFFNHFFNLGCSRADFSVCFASNERKFSCHVMLADGSYFANRVESWITSALMAKYLSEVEKDDREFSDFYSVFPSTPNGKKLVDYNVYSLGARNMRMLGCISYKRGAELGKHWTTMRPLMPSESCKSMHWTKFLATVNRAPRTEGFKEIKVDEAHYRSIIEFINHEQAQSGPLARNFGSLRPHLGGMVANLTTVSNFSAMTNYLPVRNERNAMEKQLGDIMDRILKLGDPERVPGHNILEKMARAGKEKMLRDKFLDVGRIMAERLARMIHPGQRFRVLAPNFSRGEIYRIAVDAFVLDDNGAPLFRFDDKGEQKRQRMCLLSFSDDNPGLCQGGTNQITITIMVDFSMSYFCHSCRQRDNFAVNSPIRSRTVIPVLYQKGLPEEFHGLDMDFIDYALSMEERVDVDPYMRDIGDFEGYFVHPEKKRTVLLHGGMGTGKSTSLGKYLQHAKEEWYGRTGKELRVLSISFRQMLARNAAEKFDLVYYKDDELEEASLSSYNTIAIQLDSLKRIGQVVEGAYRVQSFNVLILDESESILSHLSSETMKDRRNEVFGLFKVLVNVTNTVICADADMGRRTFKFISEVRKFAPSTHRLVYHRNPFVKKDIHYIDYKYQCTWLDALENALLVKKKRVFLVSNNKSEVRSVCTYVRKCLRDMIRKMGEPSSETERAHLHWLRCMEIEPSFIKIIDGDMSGAEKKNMAVKCNEEWKNYNLLAITPVVGAGISFDEKDIFDEAYILATPSSCDPRSINQLLGRVRHLNDNRVRVYINETGTPSNWRTALDEDSIYSEERERSRKRARIQDMTVVREEHGVLVFETEPEDDLLVRLTAMNKEETRRARYNFRAQLIQVLQKNNPSVNYTFNLDGAYQTDTKSKLQIRNANNKVTDSQLIKLSVQDEEDGATLEELEMKNNKGMRCFSDDEDEKQENITALISHNKVRHQLNIIEGTSDAVYEAYHTLLGLRQGKEEVVSRWAKYLFSSIASLYKSDSKFLAPIEIEIKNQTHIIPSKATETFDALDYRKKYWIMNLLWICGFREGELGQVRTETGPIGVLEGHSSLQKKRVEDDDTQEWLQLNVPSIVDTLGITLNRKPPKPKSDKRIQAGERQWKPNDYTTDTVGRLLKSVMNQEFNLMLSTSRTYKEEGQIKSELHPCGVHGTACRLKKPDETLYRCYLSMCHQWCNNTDLQEEWVQEARENVNALVQELGVGKLPGMQSDLHDEMDADSFMAFVEEMKSIQRERAEKKFKAQRAKRPRKTEEKTPQEKFEERWNGICEVHLGTDMYYEQDAMIYMNKMLSEGYKFKTKEEMGKCHMLMNSHRKRLFQMRAENP